MCSVVSFDGLVGLGSMKVEDRSVASLGTIGVLSSK